MMRQAKPLRGPWAEPLMAPPTRPIRRAARRRIPHPVVHSLRRTKRAPETGSQVNGLGDDFDSWTDPLTVFQEGQKEQYDEPGYHIMRPEEQEGYEASSGSTDWSKWISTGTEAFKGLFSTGMTFYSARTEREARERQAKVDELRAEHDRLMAQAQGEETAWQRKMLEQKIKQLEGTPNWILPVALAGGGILIFALIMSKRK